MAPQFVFQMLGMSKFYGDKPILQNFNLSFYLGAKIGIVGDNGAGKSTLLRISALASSIASNIAFAATRASSFSSHAAKRLRISRM